MPVRVDVSSAPQARSKRIALAARRSLPARAIRSRGTLSPPLAFADRAGSPPADGSAGIRGTPAAPPLPARGKTQPAPAAASAMGTTAGNKFPLTARRKQILRRRLGPAISKPSTEPLRAGIPSLVSLAMLLLAFVSLDFARLCSALLAFARLGSSWLACYRRRPQINATAAKLLSDSRAQSY